MFAIINQAAPSARSIRSETPEALDRLIDECLRKEPTRRPATASEVSRILRGIRDGTPSGALPLAKPDTIRAIAVLPLRNISQDPSQEYFADGMTDAIISDLARIKALRVISRTSAMSYKNTTKPLPEVARELNVDAVLEGSALLAGKRVRVSVQLISTRTDDTLWSERYDRDLEDVLSLQGELAEKVAHEIEIQLTPREAAQFVNRMPVDPEAHLEYLKARNSLFNGSPQAVELGRNYARRALSLDPSDVVAWCILADCEAFSFIRGISNPAESAARATEAARRAIEIDPNSADANASLGLILTHSGHAAEGWRYVKKAVDLNPGNANAWSLFSRSAYAFERIPDALAAIDRAINLDPLAMNHYLGAGEAYYFARQYEKSVFYYRMALELDQRFDGTNSGLARSLEALGRFDEARTRYEEGLRLSPELAWSSLGLAHLAAASGNEPEARRILGELTEARKTRVVSAWGIAVLHASLGDIDEAFEWLDAAIEEKSSGLIMLRVHPRLDPIRSDARYWPLVKKVGLDDPTPS
jgi:TolB-like protein/cytochrome c-type biogenesis protein CcmH/NrfG